MASKVENQRAERKRLTKVAKEAIALIEGMQPSVAKGVPAKPWLAMARSNLLDFIEDLEPSDVVVP